MRISIVTSVLNKRNEILSSLRSLKEQTFKNIEHIIVDGRSIDGTLEILKDYKESVRDYKVVLISEKDRGLYEALNKGIRMATGDVIGVLHAGDLFYDNHVLELVNREFENHSELDLLYGDVIFFNEDGKITRKVETGEFRKEKILKYGWHPMHTALFVRRDIYKRFGLYREDFDIASDYEFMLRVFLKGDLKVKYIPRVLVKMRAGGKSGNSPSKLLRKIIEDRKIIKELGLPDYIVILKRLYKLKQFKLIRRGKVNE